MELKRRDRVGIRHAALSCCVIAVLTVYGGIVMAQDVPIVGDHVNAVTFSSELPGSQPLQLEVIMALNNRAQ